MNSDSAFYIGSTHDVCQDFSLSGKLSENNVLYSIVADGCSSSPYSSVGARILSFSAQKELNKIYRNNARFFDFQEDICIERSRSSIASLNIPIECLDSTLITACSEKYETNIDMKGDGVAAIGLLNGDILIISVDFSSGYPYYMNYLPSYSKRYNIWAEANNECVVTMSIISSDGEYKILEKGSGENLQMYNMPIVKIKGKYLNGEVFSESEEMLNLKETLPAIQKAILGMQLNEKREIYSHPDFAFGKNPPSNNSLIIFDIEVVSIFRQSSLIRFSTRKPDHPSRSMLGYSSPSRPYRLKRGKKLSR